MHLKRIVIFFFTTAIGSFVTINGFAQDSTLKRKVTVVKDTTVIIDSDTTVSESNCREDFFGSGDKISNPSKTLLVTKTQKTVSFSSFMKTLAMAPDHVLADLDKDGKK